MDIFPKTKRSDIMSRVRSSGTDIESHLAECVKIFWKRERYRKNAKNLPGKPDILFPKSKVAVFADGDFWHGRDFDKWKNKIPDFWKTKISNNITRDKKQTATLKKHGYSVVRFWGTDIKKYPERITKKVERALSIQNYE